mmetsp:Transcript_42893/g.100662  ORF Transcript_42893/g.100662 Transcript_42893/m.100662 type:complete len:125 (+) Transcript_42893:99-473(+)
MIAATGSTNHLGAALRTRLPGLRVACLGSQTRTSLTGIKIIEDASKVQQESMRVYWALEDERLLKKMLENNPGLDPEFQGVSAIMNDPTHTATADKVKLVFIKHGIPPSNKDLIADLVALADAK